MLSNGSKFTECEVRPMAMNGDMHLLVQNVHKKQYSLKGKFDMRGVTIPSDSLMQEVIVERTGLMEAKKRENEVKPIVKVSKIGRKEPKLEVPLDSEHADYVYGSMKGVYEDKRRREKGEKRVRGTREEVLRMVFDKFEEQTCWTLSALGVATQQPEVRI